MFADGRKQQTDISRMLRGQSMINNGIVPTIYQEMCIKCIHNQAIQNSGLL
jgi:hypothetical protein